MGPKQLSIGARLPRFHFWYQWNGNFRDEVRAFVRGDNGMVNRFMTRVYGSDDLFPDSLEASYHAYQSVNFVDCHDGFNLYDLVAYNTKHNLPNGHGNTDGTDANFSWNCGWEGDDGVPPEVLALRKRQVKNFCALLMLSNGTPMFCAGDEFMHTQHGNNNPYNQDNETTWLDWDKLEANHDVFRFFQQMIAFRKAHLSLGRSRFWREDINWYGVDHEPDRSWEARSLAYCLHGARQHDVDIYVMVNSSAASLTFAIQEGQPGAWRRVIDTARSSPEDFCALGSEAPVLDPVYPVEAHSVVVLRR
jgi:glycogen operon protein